MSRLSHLLAAKSLRIQAQRAAAQAARAIDDADPVPAKLTEKPENTCIVYEQWQLPVAMTEAAQPVFRTIRDGRASVHVPYLETIAMTIAKGDRAKAATLLRAAAEHVETARVASIWPADLGALDHG